MIYYSISNYKGISSISNHKGMDMNIENRTFGNKMFWINKRLFDIIICLLLIPLLFISSIIILLFNYFANRGSLFFIQDRMGKNCHVFSAIKFRTMAPVKEITRKYDDPIETHRIRVLVKFYAKVVLMNYLKF